MNKGVGPTPSGLEDVDVELPWRRDVYLDSKSWMGAQNKGEWTKFIYT